MFNIEVFSERLDYEIASGALSDQTKKYYTEALDRLNRLCAGMPQKSSAQMLEQAVNQLCGENKQTAKYIAAIKKYERAVLQAPRTLLYGEPLARLRKQTVLICGKAPRHPAKKYARKINRLKNEKLKLALRLQQQSGLRVAEVAALRPEDISFNDNFEIIINVRNGKGRKQRTVTVRQDEYLYGRLKHLAQDAVPREPIFYKASYLMKKASEHDMETHDLRRINARLRYQDMRSKGDGKRAAKREVASQLGHEKIATTNLYLGERLARDSEEENEEKQYSEEAKEWPIASQNPD